MAAFGQMMITNRGLALQAKAQTGTALQFTAIKIGDGQLSGQAIPTLQGLVSQKLSLPISKAMTQTGKATLGAYLSNASLSTGFFFREIGIFATDPAVGEILFAYANSGATAEYIPAGGGPDIVEKYIDLVAIIQSAANVSAVIDNSLALTPLVRKINTEGGLQGGGDFSLDRTLSIAPKGVTQDKIGDKAVGSAQLANGAGTDTVIGNRTITDTTAPTGDSGAVTTLFGWLANMVKAITGKSSWRTAPATTLEAAKTHADDTTRHITATERTAWNAVGAAGGVTDTIIGNRTVSDTTAPTGDTGTLTTLLGWITNRIKAITGKSSWRTAPAISLEDAKQSLDALSTRLTDANTQTTALAPGQNLITASEAGPVAVTVKGNTSVNLLGNVGNFEVDTDGNGIADGWWKLNIYGTHTLESAGAVYGTKAQRVTAIAEDAAATRGVTLTESARPKLFSGKYYLFLAHVTTDGGATSNAAIRLDDGTTGNYAITSNWSTATKTHCVKISPPSDIIARVILYNYAPLGSTNWVQFDGARIVEVDAATYALANVDPEFSGEKLAARYPYVDGVKHITNPVITKIGKNNFDINLPFSGATALVESSTSLLVSSAASAYYYAYQKYAVIPNTTYTLSYKASNGFGPDLPAIGVRKGSDINTTIAINEALGDITLSFNTGTETSVYLCLFASRTTAAVQQKRYENIQLEVGSVATPFEPRNDDYLYALTTLAGYGGINDVLTVRGAEATVLRRWKTDIVLDGRWNWTHFLMTGCKMLYVSGELQDGLMGQQNAIFIKNDGSQLLWSPNDSFSSTLPDQWRINSTNGRVMITVGSADSGWSDTFAPSLAEMKAWANGWKMNNGTFGQPYNGTGTKTWTRWDATSNTGAVTTVPTTMAEGYTPYKLSYQLAAPVTEVVQVEGSLANHAGANLYELGEGVVVREKVVPKLDSGLYTIVGKSDSPGYWGAASTSYRSNKLLTVYRDKVKDAWTTSAGWAASIRPESFNPIAEYTVTYLALDKYAMTAPIVEGALEYKNNLSGVTSELVKQMADNNTRDTIQDGRLLLDEAYIRNLNMDLSGATAAATPSTIVKRDSGGRAQVADPVANADIVNRGFVMSNFARANYADNSYTAAALPSVYPAKATTTFFVNDPSATQGWPALYGTVQTIKGYSNMAAVQFFYPYNASVPIKFRYGLYNTDAWLAWREILDSNGPSSSAKVTGLNSDLIDGKHIANPGTHAGILDAVPFVGSDSVMEIGSVLDFHDTSGATVNDYDARLTAVRGGSSGQGTLQMMGALMQVPALRVRSATPYVDVIDTDGTHFTRIIVDGGNLVLQQRRVSDGAWINDFLTIPMSGASTSKIWTTENDGAGSGLDADLLSGKKATDFAPSGFGLGGVARRLPTGTDLNTLRDNGYYDVQNPANGVNGLTWHNVHVFCSGDTNFVTQIAFGMIEGYNRAYFRSCSSGSWIPWKRILIQDDYDTLFQFANDGKTAIANALVAKGASASPSDTFATLANRISSLRVGTRYARGSGYKSGAQFVVTGLAFNPSNGIIEVSTEAPYGYYSTNNTDRFQWLHDGTSVMRQFRFQVRFGTGFYPVAIAGGNGTESLTVNSNGFVVNNVPPEVATNEIIYWAAYELG